MDNSNLKETKKTINITRLYKACPDLVGHEILDSWFDDEGAFVIKSKLSNEFGTQFYFTRLFIKRA